MIRFSCPGCNAVYTVADEKGGKTGTCPKCQSRFQIPMPEGGAVAPPPPPVDVFAPRTPAASPPPPVDVFARTSPPPPPPPADTGTVELACPSCNGALAVSTSDLGSDVQCPYCNKVFTAARPGGSAATSKPSRALDDVLGGGTKRSRTEDDEDRPSRRRSRVEDEEERPSRRSRARADDEEEEEEGDRPRKKKKKRGSMEDHRGGMVLTYGILGLVCCIIFAFLAINMANQDLEKMERGRMDPSGEGLTKTGKVLGQVSIGLFVLGVILNIVLFVVGAAAG